VLTEQALTFNCDEESLVGIVHSPEVPAELGVLIVVGGPQYRVGSHRQFVQLARAVARAGYAVMRFDVRGMGDSSGPARSFESIQGDIAAAIDALCANVAGVRRVALWGLCDGASAAWLYLQATGDTRVHGICAVNPWARSDEGLARTQVKHYYSRRVLSREFWTKLMRGGVARSSLRDFGSAVLKTIESRRRTPAAAGDFRLRMADGCRRCRNLLLVLSGNDYTAREFADHIERSAVWQAALREHGRAVRRCEIAGADHTLSQQSAREEVERATVRWLVESSAATATELGVTA
jgi:uncharacterized protein